MDAEPPYDDLEIPTPKEVAAALGSAGNGSAWLRQYQAQHDRYVDAHSKFEGAWNSYSATVEPAVHKRAVEQLGMTAYGSQLQTNHASRVQELEGAIDNFAKVSKATNESFQGVLRESGVIDQEGSQREGQPIAITCNAFGI